MKYFNPSYWFKLWVLSVRLFSDKTQGINAMSIDNNQKIKNWASKNTTDLSLIENQQLNFTKSNITNQPYNLSQTTNQNINPIYQTELETSTHKHRHEKIKNKRQARQKGRGLKSFSKYGLEKELKVPKIKQIGCMWCAPTVAQSVLGYFNYFADQNNLSIQMQTINTANGGTIPQNLINVINNIINNNNLNNRRNYVYYQTNSFGNIRGRESLTHRHQSLNFIYSIVRNSLENNMPVMFAHSYTEQERREGRGRHFVLIDAVSNQIVSQTSFGSIFIQNREYRYMDPVDGEYYVVSGDYLYDMIGDDRFLVSMQHPNLLPSSTNSNLEENQEQIEIGQCIIDVNNCTPTTSRIKRNIESNENCFCSNKFYYCHNKNSKTFKLEYDNTHNNIVTLNLGKNNPINFDKISVLNEQDTYTKSSWGDNSYFGTKFSDFLKNKKINNLITNEKIDENNKEDFFNNHVCSKLQDENDSSFLAGLSFTQSIYPTFYWENNNYYLQFFIHQYGETWQSVSGTQSWMNIGDGIKLQKENCDESRKKRNIKSNENKWTNEFTKDINHEQHLSITNNRNYVINNITTL